MAKKIAVVGVDSLLGGAVARSLTSKFTVTGITLANGLNSGKLESLTSVGITILDSSQIDLTNVLQDFDGCFVTLKTDFTQNGYHQSDIALGKKIAEACLNSKVPHVIFNSSLSPRKILGMQARHLDSKAEVEDYMKSIGLPLTCIVCPLYYQNLLVPPIRPKRIDDLSFALELPIGTAHLDLINADDVGQVVAEMFHQGAALHGKTFNLSGDKLTTQEISACLSACLAPRIFIDRQLTIEQYRRQSTPGAEDLACMFDFYTRVDQRANISATKRFYPQTQSLDQWLQSNLHAIAIKIDCSDTPPTDHWSK